MAKNNNKFNYQIADEALVVIGKFIADRRKELGYTQQELAVKAGSLRHSISNFEAGNQNIAIKTFIAILGSLDLHIDFKPVDPDNLVGFASINKN